MDALEFNSLTSEKGCLITITPRQYLSRLNIDQEDKNQTDRQARKQDGL